MVLTTSLHNFRTPLIRYEIGDQVTLGSEPLPMRRALPPLVRVLGKRRPMFRLAGNRLKHSSGLVHAISLIGGHHQHQAEQVALDRVIVRIVPNKSWTSDHPHRLRQAVQAFFEASIRVDVEIKERLQLPRSGKLQSMICAIPLEPGPDIARAAAEAKELPTWNAGVEFRSASNKSGGRRRAIAAGATIILDWFISVDRNKNARRCLGRPQHRHVFCPRSLTLRSHQQPRPT